MTFFCKDACTDLAMCRQRAVCRVKRCLARLLFARKVPTPALGRWWRCLPTARRLLLGIACHSLWPRAVPQKVQPGAGGEARHDSAWHKVFSFRASKTFDFLNGAWSARLLITVVQGLSPVYTLMAWIMGHDCSIPPEAISNRAAAYQRQARRSREDILLQFVDPKRSPVHTALASASELLGEQYRCKHWCSVQAFTRGDAKAAILDIW